MKTYTLTTAETVVYDADDDDRLQQLRASLRERFGAVAGGLPVTTEVRHPDGFVVEQYHAYYRPTKRRNQP